MCACGYTTSFTSNWSVHLKRCKLVVDAAQEKLLAEKDAQIATLEASLAEARSSLAEARTQIAAKHEQLVAKDTQLAAKDEQLLLALKQDKKPSAPPKRKSRSEPERRDIAMGQAWRCADPDGGCLLKGQLREYEIDHITALCLDGKDIPSNMQALCPACHSRKTKRDQVKLARLEADRMSTEGTEGTEAAAADEATTAGPG